MRSIRVLRNVVTNYLRFAIAGVIGFVITPVMVHLLGDGDYGLWVTVFSLTGYFGLVDQGIRPSLVRYVSQHRAASDDQGLSRTINSAIALYTSVGVLVAIASIVLAANFAVWFKVAPEQVESARTTVLLAGLSLALGFPLGVFGAALSGLQRYDIANGLGIAIGILRGIAFVAVLRTGGGIVGLAWASLGANLLGHLLSWYWARRLMPTVRFGPRFVTGEHLRRIGSYSGIAFIGALANSLAFQTDALVITAFLGAALVTPFALAAGLVEQARSLVYSATFVLSPTASEMHTLGESDQLGAMLIAGTKYSVLLSWPVLMALVVFGGNLIETWIGPAYASAATLLTILALPTFIALPQSTASSVLYGISRHRGAVVLSLAGALANLGLSIWWVRPFGLTGVAMGTAVPLVLIGGVATGVFVCRVMGLSLRRYTWEGMVRPGFATLAFLAPALVVQALWRPIGWLPLGLTVAGCWLPFAACAWRFSLSAEERARWVHLVPRLLDGAAPTPAPIPSSGGRP
ncbi:MAG TPA: oligosaccharide flippase family protein [Candidatus Limnocylindria bacterium]|nr:oligosaccharide flippase family protein [Candidatus Limnocylindria bacterium]